QLCFVGRRVGKDSFDSRSGDAVLGELACRDLDDAMTSRLAASCGRSFGHRPTIANRPVGLACAACPTSLKQTEQSVYWSTDEIDIGMAGGRDCHIATGGRGTPRPASG